MEIPEFIDPQAPDFQARLMHVHAIKEHLDMVLFGAYARIIEDFFEKHPGVVALQIENGSDGSDDGRYAHVQAIIEEDGEEDEVDDAITDELADEINMMRDHGFYGALDAMFEKGRIEREDVMGQFQVYWVQDAGAESAAKWKRMVAAPEKASLEARTGPARAPMGPSARM